MKAPVIKHTAIRTHEISVAHRLVGHSGGCSRIHGHNYVIETHVSPLSGVDIDAAGMVMDFGKIKTSICKWLNDNWDHRLILASDDPLLVEDPAWMQHLELHAPGSLIVVPFTPTAELMSEFLLQSIFPKILALTNIDVEVTAVTIHETRNCRAHATRACDV